MQLTCAGVSINITDSKCGPNLYQRLKNSRFKTLISNGTKNEKFCKNNAITKKNTHRLQLLT